MRLGIILAALLASGSAAAQQQGHFGVGVGQSSLDTDTAGADRVDDSDTAIKGFVGARIAEGLGVEVGLASLGRFSAHYPAYDEYSEVRGGAAYGALLGRIDAGPVQLFAKGGLAYWSVGYDGRATIGGTTYYANGDGTGAGLMFGAGVGVAITDQVGLRFEFERFTDVGDGVEVNVPGVGSTELDGEDVDVITVSAVYSF